MRIGWLVIFFLIGRGAETAAAEGFETAIDVILPRVVKLFGATVGSQPPYGAGVIVSPDGQVVTTDSFLLEATRVRAVTADGRVHAAKVLFRDPHRQLALLQLEPGHEQKKGAFPHFPIGSSADLEPGDWIVAAANPFKVADGKERASISIGIFSTRVRLTARQSEKDFPYDGPVLVIDAVTANPGSAGGALVDLDGRWVGLLGEIVTSRLTNTRLSYAIPVEEVKAFLEEAAQAKRTGRDTVSLRPERFEPGYHGIKLLDKTYRRNRVFAEGAVRGSPAEAAGIRPDDRIVSVNGLVVRNVRGLRRILEKLRAGEQVVLVVERGRELITLRLTLTERPKP